MNIAEHKSHFRNRKTNRETGRKVRNNNGQNGEVGEGVTGCPRDFIHGKSEEGGMGLESLKANYKASAIAAQVEALNSKVEDLKEATRGLWRDNEDSQKWGVESDEEEIEKGDRPRFPRTANTAMKAKWWASKTDIMIEREGGGWDLSEVWDEEAKEEIRTNNGWKKSKRIRKKQILRKLRREGVTKLAQIVAQSGKRIQNKNELSMNYPNLRLGGVAQKRLEKGMGKIMQQIIKNEGQLETRTIPGAQREFQVRQKCRYLSQRITLSRQENLLRERNNRPKVGPSRGGVEVQSMVAELHQRRSHVGTGKDTKGKHRRKIHPRMGEENSEPEKGR